MGKLSNLKDKININGRDIFNNFKDNYSSKANEYVKDPNKLNNLYKKSKEKARKSKGPLSEVWDELKMIFELVRDWKDGNYKEIPKNSLIMIIIALIYFIVPTDAIVDVIPVLGLVDDATILAFVIKQIENDLKKYKEWKFKQE